jgi:hypothetical protein
MQLVEKSVINFILLILYAIIFRTVQYQYLDIYRVYTCPRASENADKVIGYLLVLNLQVH